MDGSREQRRWGRETLDTSHDEFSDSEDESDDEIDRTLTPESGPSEDDSFTTESGELCLSINESITSLLRLSVQLHKSFRGAKFSKSSTEQDYPVDPDISHVRDFFPHASTNDMLVEKLGKANAQRRQWLWYRRRHREKLSVDLSGSKEDRIPWFKSIERSDFSSLAKLSHDDDMSEAMPSLTGTKATTFRSRVSTRLDVASLSEAPETVFGRSSRATVEEQRLMVPEMPANLFAKQPSQCPYCCNVIKISNKNAWQ